MPVRKVAGISFRLVVILERVTFQPVPRWINFLTGLISDPDVHAGSRYRVVVIDEQEKQLICAENGRHTDDPQLQLHLEQQAKGGTVQASNRHAS
jgi:hypothetical protein